MTESTSSKAKKKPGPKPKPKAEVKFRCYMCLVEHKQTGIVYYRPFCSKCNVKMEKVE